MGLDWHVRRHHRSRNRFGHIDLKTGATDRHLVNPRSDSYKAQLTQEFMDNVYSYLADGQVKPIIDSTFPLDQVKEAHEYMEANKNIGKIILTIQS